ncbi:hypothetical protein L484_017905 [Morus notabilis]|uniref:Uncharacterized protein n=1 Tax=Morus notabilis TaxID=981085 RepID=W9RH99_9ROSA|nr:hypothetical protein L484_017905 [Morus notabilis]
MAMTVNLRGLGVASRQTKTSRTSVNNSCTVIAAKGNRRRNDRRDRNRSSVAKENRRREIF